MALSDDLRERVVKAVVEEGVSRNAAAKRFGVSIPSAVRWVKRFETTGGLSAAPSGGDQRSKRIEAHRDYLLGLVRRCGSRRASALLGVDSSATERIARAVLRASNG